MLADELFWKSFTKSQICVLVNNNLCGNLISSLELPIIFNERFRVNSVPFFSPDFNLLICELDNYIFQVLYGVVLYWYYIKTKIKLQHSHSSLWKISNGFYCCHLTTIFEIIIV